eukprot:TRINITY_DN5345_c0_g1_i5.p1 TRINITY_DN5345_c0_g1~~TRINITY_DN5345_c0_g1_i5.p1  ORF type:complete len:192 (-),score=28.16 TRINITY_DN5345_c0_g1_i5:231-806(-)
MESYHNQIAAILGHGLQNLNNLSSASTCFDCVCVPRISLGDYLARIRTHSDCTDYCFVLALIYIDRLLLNNPGFTLSKKNMHRVILTSIVLAIKYSDDFYLDNEVYARIGGVSLAELNYMERAMLCMMRHELYVNSDLLFNYIESIEIQYQNRSMVEEKREESRERDKEVKCMGRAAEATSMTVDICRISD